MFALTPERSLDPPLDVIPQSIALYLVPVLFACLRASYGTTFIVSEFRSYNTLILRQLKWYHSLGAFPGRSKTNLNEVITNSVQGGGGNKVVP